MSLASGIWEAIGELPDYRRRPGYCVIGDNRVALVGGESNEVTLRTVEVMTVSSTLHFDSLPPLRAKRAAVGAAATSGGIFVCGGTWQTQGSESEDEATVHRPNAGFAVLAECWLLHPGGSAWLRCPDYPDGPCDDVATCALPDGRVFAAGGNRFPGSCAHSTTRVTATWRPSSRQILAPGKSSSRCLEPSTIPVLPATLVRACCQVSPRRESSCTAGKVPPARSTSCSRTTFAPTRGPLCRRCPWQPRGFMRIGA